jgi:hypothetical protein
LFSVIIVAMESRIGCYNHTWLLRGVSASPESVMDGFKSAPQEVFPFRMQGRDRDGVRIEEGVKIDLFPLVVRAEPVAVTAETATSFTFTSLPGHIHGPGATIEFSIFERDNNGLYLQQSATFPRRLLTAPLAVGARPLWSQQARRLRQQARRNS